MASEVNAWSGHPSQILNLGTYIICGLILLAVVGAAVVIPHALWLYLAAAVAVIAVLYAFWQYLTVRCQVYELTSQRLKIHSGVLNKKTDELELYRVKDTRFEQPLFLRLFGLGNVIIVSSDTTTPNTIIPAIANGSDLREQLRTLVETRRDEKRVRVAEIE